MDLQDSIRGLIQQVQEGRRAAEPDKDYQIADAPIPSEAVTRLLEDPVGLFEELNLAEETTRVTVARKPRISQLSANLVLVLWSDTVPTSSSALDQLRPPLAERCVLRPC